MLVYWSTKASIMYGTVLSVGLQTQDKYETIPKRNKEGEKSWPILIQEK
jgi:hypothetical protein